MGQPTGNLYEDVANLRAALETRTAEILRRVEAGEADVRQQLAAYAEDHSAWRAAQAAAEAAEAAELAAAQAAEAALDAVVEASAAEDAAELAAEDVTEDQAVEDEPHPDDEMVPPPVPAKPAEPADPAQKGWADRYAAPRHRG